MQPILIVATLFLALLLAIFLIRKKGRSRKPPTQRKHSGAPAANAARHWGVTLLFPDPANVCKEALALQHEKINKERAHPLPLPGCDKPNCRCYYEKLRENRTEQDRRNDEERRSGIRFEDKTDRRSHADRRNSTKE